MRRLVFDAEDMLDGLARDGAALREAIAGYRAAGFEVVISMPGGLPGPDGGTPADSLGALKPLAGLCDTIVFGGPCSAPRGLHLDDKAVTLEEFIGQRYEELRTLVTPT